MQGLKRGALISAAIAMSLGLAGCVDTGSSDSPTGAGNCKRSDQKVIGFDHPLNTSPVWAQLKKFASKRAEERGYDLRTTADDANVQTQVDNVQAWITQGIPAFMTLPLEPSAMEPVAREALDKCTVVVTYANPLKNQTAQIGLSAEESGRLLGANAVEWAEKSKRQHQVLLLTGNDLVAGKQRYEGIKSAVEHSSMLEVVADQKAMTTQDAESVTRQVLRAHPDITMVLAWNDDAALGAKQALVNSGKSADDPGLYVGGIDGSELALQELKKGTIFRCSVALRLRDVGYAAVDVPADILEGKSDDGIDIPAVALVPGDPRVDEFLADYGS